MTGEGESFIFVRENGATFNNINDGPLTDSEGSRSHHFAYISAKNSEHEDTITEIEIPMIPASNHLIECFHFWFSIKVFITFWFISNTPIRKADQINYILTLFQLFNTQLHTI